MNTTLRPAPVSISQFTFDRATRQLSAELSEIRGLGRVWADSCDEGLTIVGATGREVVMVVDHHERRDGDLLWLDLKPANRADAALVASVRLWND